MRAELTIAGAALASIMALLSPAQAAPKPDERVTMAGQHPRDVVQKTASRDVGETFDDTVRAGSTARGSFARRRRG